MPFNFKFAEESFSALMEGDEVVVNFFDGFAFGLGAGVEFVFGGEIGAGADIEVETFAVMSLMSGTTRTCFFCADIGLDLDAGGFY